MPPPFAVFHCASCRLFRRRRCRPSLLCRCTYWHKRCHVTPRCATNSQRVEWLSRCLLLRHPLVCHGWLSRHPSTPLPSPIAAVLPSIALSPLSPIAIAPPSSNPFALASGHRCQLPPLPFMANAALHSAIAPPSHRQMRRCCHCLTRLCHRHRHLP